MEFELYKNLQPAFYLTEEASTICTNLRVAARISCGDLQTEVKAGVQMIEKGLF